MRAAYGQMGPAVDEEQVWYGEGGGWRDGQGQQAWYRGQGWFDQDSFDPLTHDFGSDQGQYYQPEQQGRNSMLTKSRRLNLVAI